MTEEAGPGHSGPAAEAERAIEEIFAALESAERGVVVDSPPGAGKSTLVVRAAAKLARDGHRVMIVAQVNEQVDDLTANLAEYLLEPGGGQGGSAPAEAAGLGGSAPGAAAGPGDSAPGAAAGPSAAGGPGGGQVLVGRLYSSSAQPPERVWAKPNVKTATALSDLDGCAVILSTAAKWATLQQQGEGGEGSPGWPWAIIDEAYQMRSDLLLRVAWLFDKALFVGDPGQLDPFSVVDTDRFKGLPWDPMASAVAVMLANNPSAVPVKRLPLSWRLPTSAAPLICEAFYPFAPFRAATAAADRQLSWGTVSFGQAPVDKALDIAAEHGWALYELPGGHKPRTDKEAVSACAEVVERLLQRGAVATSERSPAPVPLAASRIAVGVAHRDQARAVRNALAERGVPVDGTAAAQAEPGVVVDTANRLQGREFDVTVVLHPLSGRRDATAFHLEAGRLCVLLSRHRHACIVVARAGIAELLDDHPSSAPVYLNVPVKFPDGWEAHQAVMSHLEGFRVPAP